MKRALDTDNDAQSSKKSSILPSFDLPSDCIAVIFSFMAGGHLRNIKLVCRQWNQILETNIGAYNAVTLPTLMTNQYIQILQRHPEFVPNAQSLQKTFVRMYHTTNMAKRVLFEKQANLQLNSFRKYFVNPMHVRVIHFSVKKNIRLNLRLRIGEYELFIFYLLEDDDFTIKSARKEKDSRSLMCCSEPFYTTNSSPYKRVILNQPTLSLTNDIFMEMIFRLYFLDEWTAVIERINNEIMFHYKKYPWSLHADRCMDEKLFYDLIVNEAPDYN